MGSRSPFSLFTRETQKGKIWYSRFYNYEKNKYTDTRSTGVLCTGKYGGRKKAQEIAETYLEAIHNKQSKNFLEYISGFWKPDSRYVKHKALVEKKPLSEEYRKNNEAGIKKYVLPFSGFNNKATLELTSGIIEDWKLWSIEQGIGSRRLNAVLSSMKVAVNYLFDRGEIDKNPFQTIKKVPYCPKEKGVLSFNEIEKVFLIEEKDPRVKVAFLLAVSAGLRRGECRGLKWRHIDRETGLIEVVNNYIDGEGDKPCKWGSARKAILSERVIPFLDFLETASPATGQEDYILFHDSSKEEPISKETIRHGTARMMEAVGIPKKSQKERNLTFHGLRHTFVTFARMAGLPDIVVQSLAGHADASMMNHYSHGLQAIDYEEARRKLKAVGEG